MGERLAIDENLTIDADELAFSFIRSPGPGGQNVNKVASAVQLRFDLSGSPSLPQGVKQRAARLAGSRLTADGGRRDRHHRQRLAFAGAEPRDGDRKAAGTAAGGGTGAEGPARDAADAGFENAAISGEDPARRHQEPEKPQAAAGLAFAAPRIRMRNDVRAVQSAVARDGGFR